MDHTIRRNGSSFLDIEAFQMPAPGLEHIDSNVGNVGEQDAKAGGRGVELD